VNCNIQLAHFMALCYMMIFDALCYSSYTLRQYFTHIRYKNAYTSYKIWSKCILCIPQILYSCVPDCRRCCGMSTCQRSHQMCDLECRCTTGLGAAYQMICLLYLERCATNEQLLFTHFVLKDNRSKTKF